MRHARLRERLPDFALDLLDPGPATELEDHLAGCEACHAEARLYAEAAAALAIRTPPPSLPEGTLDRIAERVRAAVAVAAPESEVRAARRADRGWRVLAFALGALVVLLAGSTAAAGIAWYRAHQDATAAASGSSSSAYQYRLQGQNGIQVQGLAFVASDHSLGALSVDGLPQLEGGKETYVLWSQAPTQTRDLRPFNPGRDGKAIINFGATPPSDGRLFITREPYPPPPAPTGPVVITFE